MRARVRRRLPRAVRPKVAESDVLQEAFLAAFQKLGEFEDRGDGSFTRWLGTILERKILDEVRNYVGTSKRDVRRELAVQSGIADLAGAAPQRAASADLREADDLAEVGRAMDRLPEAQRQVLRLVHREQLTIEQAAARLGRSLAAARKLYARGILRLSTDLGASGPAPG